MNWRVKSIVTRSRNLPGNPGGGDGAVYTWQTLRTTPGSVVKGYTWQWCSETLLASSEDHVGC